MSLACALVGGSPRRCSSLTSRPSGWTRSCAATCGRLFHRLADQGVTLVVSSHVMDEAARCDRLLLLREQRPPDDTPEQLRQLTGTDDLEAAFLHLAEQQEALA